MFNVQCSMFDKEMIECVNYLQFFSLAISG
jgi:hypothetical protein